MAEIKTKNSTLTRPISKLCLLEEAVKNCVYRNLRVLETDSNDQVLTGGLLVLNFPRIYFAESVKFSQTPQDVGANFFSFCFSFSHLLVIVYSFSFRSPVFC